MRTLFIAGKYVFLAMIITGSFYLISCGESEVGNSIGSHAVIEGRVFTSDNNGKPTPVQGASIVLTKIQPNGAVEKVCVSTAYSDKTGYFRVKTDAFNIAHLVVVAKHHDNTWKETLNAPLTADSRIEDIRIDEETTVETEIYNRLKLVGKHEKITIAEIESYVDFSIAQAIVQQPVEIANLAESIFEEITQDPHQAISEIQPKIQQFQGVIIRRSSPEAIPFQELSSARVFLRVKGDVPLTENARRILDSFAKQFGTYTGNRSVIIKIHKQNAQTTVNRDISGAISKDQELLIEQLKNRIRMDINNLHQADIHLTIGIYLHNPPSSLETV